MRACDEPVVLTEKGDLVTIPEYPGVVRWPACPVSYGCLRRMGEDARPLDQALDWLLARGAHRHPALGSGAALLYRERLATRTLGRTMLKVRIANRPKRVAP